MPSRRSTLHHSGARSIVRAGQRRSLRSIGWKGRYFETGIDAIVWKPRQGMKRGAVAFAAAPRECGANGVQRLREGRTAKKNLERNGARMAVHMLGP